MIFRFQMISNRVKCGKRPSLRCCSPFRNVPLEQSVHVRIVGGELRRKLLNRRALFPVFIGSAAENGLTTLFHRSSADDARTKTAPYQLHRATKQAKVRLNRKDHYLGCFDSPESRERYDDLLAEWLEKNSDQRRTTLTVGELVLMCWDAESPPRG